jgi:subtilisin family serine protease
VRILRVITAVSAVLAVLLGLLWIAAGPVAAHMFPTTVWAPRTVDVRSEISTSTVYSLYLPVLPYGFEARLDPDDPMYVGGIQWALEQVRAPYAWPVSKGHGVTVAVVDTGVDLSHPDLVGALWTNTGEVDANGWDDDGNGYVDDARGWDFIDGDGVPADGYGHGTHVAGIVGAATDNGIGVAGIGWDVTLMPVRVLDDGGNGDDWTVSEGIRYAADNGAQVINLSLGNNSGSFLLQQAVAYAQQKGALVVAAAGNSNSSYAFYPASYGDVVGVAATDSADQKAYFSNYGTYVDIAAPGTGIYSTELLPVGYAYKSGTSMATPMVSGLAALVWAQYPSAIASEVATAIQNGAEDLGEPGWDPTYGWGRIDAAQSLHSTSFVSAQLQPDDEPAEIAATPASHRPGEVIVSLRGALSVQQVAGLSIAGVSRQAGLYLLRVPAGKEEAIAEMLQERADVVYAHPNYLLSVASPWD